MSYDLTYGQNVDLTEISVPNGLDDSATVIIHNLGPGTLYVGTTANQVAKNYSIPLAVGERFEVRTDHPLIVVGDSSDPSVTLQGGSGRTRVVVMQLIG